jgi:hypothetical protein
MLGQTYREGEQLENAFQHISSHGGIASPA